MDGVDNTRINMKLHTFYGLVQCAEIKCSHYSRFCFCIEIQSVVHSNTQNPNPTPKAYCILDLQLQLACLLLPLCLFISTSNTHTHTLAHKTITFHCIRAKGVNKGVKQTEDQHREY